MRKALGVRRRDILCQFLAESVAIASIGSGIGTTTGFVAAFAVAAGLRWMVPSATLHASFTVSALATSNLSALVIGLTFETFPAVRAARLSPIEAIRHD